MSARLRTLLATLGLFLAAPPAVVCAAAPERPLLPLAIAGMAEDLAAAAFERLRDVAPAAPAEAALTWDDGQGAILQPDGAVVSRPASLQDVQTTVDKWRLLDRLAALGGEHAMPIEVVPPEGPHPAGSSLRIAVTQPPRPYLTVFVLSGTGELALLFPQQEDELRSQLGMPFVIDTVVTPPFGADHIVALATDAEVPELHGLLRILDGHNAGEEVAAALARTVASLPYALGIAGIYTTP